MCSVDLSTRGCDGRVVVALRGELDVADAANVVAALAAVAVREREIIVDLAGSGRASCHPRCDMISAGSFVSGSPSPSIGASRD